MPSRQLAAIMFTDIVGYTSLMGSNEQKAFELLNKNRQIQRPIIEEFNGHWIKELGDGVLSSFNTVSDAVYAALRIQEACLQTKEFQLRIGIHLGDVTFENNDVFGDGVNIASRIQALAPPGGIWISESVRNNVLNKNDIKTAFVKTASLKNVKEPVRIHQVLPKDASLAGLRRSAWISAHSKRLILISLAVLLLCIGGYFIYKNTNRAKPLVELSEFVMNDKSIAVLPFEDMSPEKDQAYLGDGLAEEIINSITVIKDLKVIGRTSSFQFKGKGLDIKTIGEKLGVGSVLEGSIQKSGNNLRISVKLIRVRDDSILWKQRFDKELKDIFAIQDSIALNIVENLKITLSESERPRLFKKETDQEVYNQYLKGLHTYKESAYEKSIEYNLKAIAIDSTFAPSFAYVALAKTWIINRDHRFSDFPAINEAKEYANKAIKLDPDLAEGYSALALSAWSVELDFVAARLNFEKSIQLNPSASLIKNRYGYFLLWMGDFDKVVSLATDAIRSDPADYNGYLLVANANLHSKKFVEAEKYILEGQRLFPGNSTFDLAYVRNKFHLGKYDEVIRTVNKLFAGGDPDSSAYLTYQSIAYLRLGNSSASNAIVKTLREREKQFNINFFLAQIYAAQHLKDSCFARLERSFANRETMFKSYKIEPLFDFIRQDPRYAGLYRKYGFARYDQK